MSPYEFLLREIRLARTAANLTQDGLGERIHFSPQKVSAIETGRAPLTAELINLIDDATAGAGRLVRMWDDLVKDGSAPTWLREWIEIEREAVALRWYEPAFVPGLLQTEAYARAVLGAGGLLQVDEVEGRVQSRLERQSILTRERPPSLYAVIDDAVLRRTVGGDRELMRAQLEHLAACAERPHVHIHVVQAGNELYLGLAGAFIIAEMADAVRYAHLDHQVRAQFVDRPDDIATVQAAWDAVCGEQLPRRHSLDVIKEAVKTWT
ncbi:helix-turn-helix transcriptional regulator [Micromonospora sp. WMMD1076]|uniref:helix-turn-helix domain-containing protein n=1 Tax=Micromonospora sp. WMMD1076 TaxID=3016103 RepID=UPI00249BFC43|nr:helix-turn-helix transcriptional regulator [Micromonospora sp. WMMD1076]WFF09129.1 helix-turn-helix transcriptional regulator [Micromonospora sp. WMMD1076]